MTIDPSARVYIAGHRGLVGSAVWRHLEGRGFADLVGRTSAEVDLRDRPAVDAFFDAEKPEYVVAAAAKVGGILANSTYPAEFLSDNLRIQLNVMDAAARTGVRKLLFRGSSCIYPKFAPQPIHEDSLLTDKLEETNDAYAIAKIAGVMQTQALRREYGLPYISAMPTNLYGPGDNFHPTQSHVLPAMIRRFDEAVRDGLDEVVLWGTGTPRRELLDHRRHRTGSDVQALREGGGGHRLAAARLEDIDRLGVVLDRVRAQVRCLCRHRHEIMACQNFLSTQSWAGFTKALLERHRLVTPWDLSAPTV